MKNAIPLAVFVVYALLPSITGCDEPEVSRSRIRFASATTSISEGQKRADIKISLDKPATSEIVVVLQTAGTAIAGDDFFCPVTVSIEAGKWEQTFTVDVVDDNSIESGETVEVQVIDAAGPAMLSESAQLLKHVVSIANDDVGKLTMELSWDAGDGTPGDVDMDLIIFKEDSPGSNEYFFLDGAFSAGTDFEKLELPINAPNANYGLTFKYYSGTSDDLAYTITYTVDGGTVDGQGTKSFVGHYDLDNVNDGPAMWLEQILTKNGTAFTLSPIYTPTEGSRTKAIMAHSPIMK